MGFSRYDIWKTTPPDDNEILAGECNHCGIELYHGDDVYCDSRDGEHYCNKDCFKNYIKDHISSEVDYYIELLEKEKDTYETTIEAQEEDY